MRRHSEFSRRLRKEAIWLALILLCTTLFGAGMPVYGQNAFENRQKSVAALEGEILYLDETAPVLSDAVDLSELTEAVDLQEASDMSNASNLQEPSDLSNVSNLSELTDPSVLAALAASLEASDSSDTSEPITRAGLGDLLGGLDLGSLLEAVGSDSSASSSSANGSTGTGTGNGTGSTGSSIGSGATSAAMDILMGLLGVSGRKISDCKISAIADQKYTGKPITPLPVITYNGTRLKKNTDYTVRYSNNTKTGTAKCVITGKGNYEGQKTVSFKIVSKSSKAGKSGGSSSKADKSTKFTVQLSATSYTYNGTAKKPTVKVTAGKKTVPKTQYTVTYKNNKNVGKATVTVKGKGDYKGYQGEATFKIELKKTALKSASSPASGEIKAGWTADTQADSYQLQACTNKSFSSGVKKLTVKPGSKSTGSFTGLTTGKKYYVRIRSCKKVGSSNWYSTWSAARQVTVK